MDRETLAGLGREELLEMVVRQQQEVIERQRELIEGLERQVALQAERLAELEAELAGLGQPPKTPGNSSVPPSGGFKPNRAERRARKRGRGHDGISRRRQPPDVIVRCRPGTCRGCGEPLPLAGQRRVGRSQVVELPSVRPVVVEAWQYAARCRSCGTRTQGAYPEGLEPTRTFGPGRDEPIEPEPDRPGRAPTPADDLRQVAAQAGDLDHLQALTHSGHQVSTAQHPLHHAPLLARDLRHRPR